ncbi:M-phase inducer phosphatase [Fusarium culmorum]|uniref:M-phase inducer phosphatase n=1 Tax=Fusarium culmorum TaxID=5516 RepID=A0A2T4GFV8_FUSCU|nr:M-phase inducer phosphatase [Fusarium culmorum]PTD02582.1 M-phase inducer phosphatase [Fusarium culmorum]
MTDAVENAAEDLCIRQAYLSTAPMLAGNRKPLDSGGPAAALPSFFSTRSMDRIPRINQQTFIRFLNGEFDETVDDKMIIDCRFDYEFNGGHIKGAVGIDDFVIDGLFERPTWNRLVIVLYCEFSLLRAPMTATSIRSRDRERNIYPELTYPDVYVLEGGYSSFFHYCPDRCVPREYIHMSDAAHGERVPLQDMWFYNACT